MFGILEWFIVISGVAGLVWAFYNYKKLSEVNLGFEAED